MIVQKIRIMVFFAVLLVSFHASAGDSQSEQSFSDPREEKELEANRKILVEIFLPRDRKIQGARMTDAFQAVSVKKVRTQFFYPENTPLQNIAIGKEVPAQTARLAIKVALDYNQGIDFLVQQFRFPPYYIGIGTSAFDEAFQAPVTPEELKQLSDPALTTSQFHSLYRRLTGESEQSLRIEGWPVFFSEGRVSRSRYLKAVHTDSFYYRGWHG